MNLKVVNKVRTNNFNDELILQKITDMWKHASSELVDYKGITYGLYHEYESDYKGDYTVCVAIEEENESPVVIPRETKYEIFKVNPDDEQGVYNVWKEIWKREEEGQLKRAYTYDYEKYDQDGNIDIWIAVE